MRSSVEKELVRILKKVNALLRREIPTISDPRLKKKIQEAERYSRFRHFGTMDHSVSLSVAITRAKRKAKEYGEPVVVVDDGGARMIVLTKARLLEDKPFGLGQKHIVYETKGDRA